MKNIKSAAFTIISICCICTASLTGLAASAFADTFINPKTGETLHGYPTSKTEEGKTIVHTKEKGRMKLTLKDWQIKPNRIGRKNQVVLLSIDDAIMLQIETESMARAIRQAADKGPLFILLQIDTPGGRVDYTRRICSAITQTRNCKIIGFINGKKYGGALSAGTAIAFACDRLYMTTNSVIGAAAPVALTAGKVKDFELLYGEKVAEKINSAWRSYLASLAEKNDRPGLLAGAMVDLDLEVIEVAQGQRRLYIEPVNKNPEQKILHTWSKKGSLLSLTARDAVKCGMADQIIDSQKKSLKGCLTVLLKDLNAGQAELIIDDAFQKARERLERAKQRFKKTSENLDLKIKQLKTAPTRRMTLALLRDIRDGYKSLLVLAELYPDLDVHPKSLKQQLNSVEALYKETKMTGRFTR